MAKASADKQWLSDTVIRSIQPQGWQRATAIRKALEEAADDCAKAFYVAAALAQILALLHRHGRRSRPQSLR